MGHMDVRSLQGSQPRTSGLRDNVTAIKSCIWTLSQGQATPVPRYPVDCQILCGLFRVDLTTGYPTLYLRSSKIFGLLST